MGKVVATKPHPDDELLACRLEALWIDQYTDTQCDAVDDLPGDHPRFQATYAEARALMVNYHAAVERATRLPAKTSEGLQAKADLVLSYLCRGENSAEIALSLACDVLGRAGA